MSIEIFCHPEEQRTTAKKTEVSIVFYLPRPWVVATEFRFGECQDYCLTLNENKNPAQQVRGIATNGNLTYKTM